MKSTADVWSTRCLSAQLSSRRTLVWRMYMEMYDRMKSFYQLPELVKMMLKDHGHTHRNKS